ncbi:MAG TPA: hypothetical protein VM869_09785 [Enhygromyxa sp.]|nr:hypothetical protein [Enhygromyxa sp.]
MDEILRFYVLRKPDALPADRHISLDTNSDFQTALKMASTHSVARHEIKRLLDCECEPLARDIACTRSATRDVLRRIDDAPSSEDHVPIERWVKEAFGRSLAEVVGDPNAFLRGTARLKDALTALRVAHELGPETRSPAPERARCPVPGSRPSQRSKPAAAALARRLVPERPAAAMIANVQTGVRVEPMAAYAATPLVSTELRGLVPDLIATVRVRQLLHEAALGERISTAQAKAVMHRPMSVSILDALPIRDLFPLEPNDADRLASAKEALASLTELILRIARACPYETMVSVDGRVVMTNELVDEVIDRYLNLLWDLDDLPGGSATGVLQNGTWEAFHALLEAKARYLVHTIADLRRKLAASGAPDATAPSFVSTEIGGHMQFAGVADVHVFREHVVGYERGEIAHIENVLSGEKRTRNYRTLTRREEEKESAAETSTIEEKEIKTEERSLLKSEASSVLKEMLDVRVGVDLQVKVGETFKLGLNTSVGYSRSKEDSSKVATEFAKDVTNRAALRVEETVRQSERVRLLRETEEWVEHGFDNQGTGRKNVVGIYQWIQKVHEVRHFLPGYTSAIFDGIVLQPAQRLLGLPTGASTVEGTPPDPIDFSASDIHPWNYLELTSRYGAGQVPPPPPLTQGVAHSFAQSGGSKELGVASTENLAVPDGYLAGYAGVSWYSGWDIQGDALRGSRAEISLGSTKLDSGTKVIDSNGDIDNGRRGGTTLMLAGERTWLPFAALFYGGYGAQCAVNLTCVRTIEKYQTWQLAVFAAITAAYSRSRQAYEEKLAQAQLQVAYENGPSPGRISSIIRDEIKRCAIGVMARQAAGKTIFQRIDDLYAAANTKEIARLTLIYEHAFEWDNMAFVLYPYFWADGRNEGWRRHTSRDDDDQELMSFFRAGAARVVVPVRPSFLRSVLDPTIVEEDLAAILGETLTLDDLLKIGSPRRLAIEDELGKPKTLEYVDQWTTRVPTQLVVLRDTPEEKLLPTWKWSDDGKGGSWTEENP